MFSLHTVGPLSAHGICGFPGKAGAFQQGPLNLQTFSIYYLTPELYSPVPQFPFSERNWIM